MAASETITVLLADDHSVFRRGMRELLAEDDQLEIVSEVSTGREAVEQALDLKPNLIVMDVRMPDMDGIAATREIKANAPETEVLVVSAYDDDDQIFQALQAGASGYLIKDDAPETMLRAVHSASSGKLYLGPLIAKRVLERVSREPATRQQRGQRELTARETMVLRLIAQGKRNREIAAMLGISERTVGNHIANLFAKLHIQDRAQAIVYAIRRGLVKI